MAETILDRLVTILGFRYDAAGLQKFQSGLDKTKQRLDKVAMKTGIWGAAITTSVGGMVAMFSGVETEMAKIQGLVGINADQIKAWQPQLKRISEDTAISLKDLGNALFFITSAGLRGSEAMEVLEMTAKAAAAGLGDQAAIADVVTSAMNAYGSENLNATDAVNSLVEAVRVGKLAPESLAAAMGRALPIASALGVEFQEVAGILAAMTKTGTTVEEGVTQLNALMSALIKPQANSTRALEAVGLTVKDLRDVARDKGVFAMLEMLKGKFGEGDAWIEALGQVIPNVRAMRGVLDLMGPQMASNKELLDEMADSTGVLDGAFNITSDTIGFKFKKAMNRANLAMMEMGSALIPLTIKLIGWVNKIIDVFNRYGGVAKTVVVPVAALGVGFLALAAAAKTTAWVIGGLNTIVKAAIFLHKWYAKQTILTTIGVKALAVAEWAKTVATWAAVKAQIALNIATTAFPWFLLIAALAAIGYAIWRFRDQIVGALKAVLGFLKRHWPTILAALAGPIGLAVLAIIRHRDKIIAAIRAVFDFIVNVGKKMYEVGRNFILTLWKGIKSGAKTLINGVKSIFGKVRKFLPFSDAKEGPFRDLTKSGRAFGETFARGIEQSVGSIQRAIGTLAVPLPIGSPLAVAAAGSSSSSFRFRVDRLEVNVPSGDPEVIAAEIIGRMDSEMRLVAEGYDSDLVA